MNRTARSTALRVPGDGGVTGLGLIIQAWVWVALIGGAIWFLIMMITGMMRSTKPDLLVWMLTLSFFGRGVVHGGVGIRLSSPTGRPKPAVHAYLASALLQLLLLFVVSARGGSLAFGSALGSTVLLLAWPVTLLWLIHSDPVGSAMAARELDAGGEVGVDRNRGVTGAALLMVIAGVMGAATLGTTLIVLREQLAAARGFGAIFLVLALVGLTVRGAVHAISGFEIYRTRALASIARSSNRYVAVGFITSALFLVAMMAAGAPPPMGFMLAVGISLCLAVWPVIVASHMTAATTGAMYTVHADGDVPSIAPARDGGVATIGGLLLFNGVFRLSTNVARLFDIEVTGMLGGMGAAAGAQDVAVPGPLLIGLALLTIWAGVEMIRVSSRIRLAASVYALISVITAAWSFIVVSKHLDGLLAFGPMMGTQMLVPLMVVSVAVTLVVPAVTVWVAFNAKAEMSPQDAADVF